MNRKKVEPGILNPNVPILLTIKQAAKVLGVTVWAMRTRVWNGEVPVVRFEGERKQYIDRRDLERLIARNKYVRD